MTFSLLLLVPKLNILSIGTEALHHLKIIIFHGSKYLDSYKIIFTAHLSFRDMLLPNGCVKI